MSKKLLNSSFSFSLSKLILKSPAITISLLQFSNLDIIGVIGQPRCLEDLLILVYRDLDAIQVTFRNLSVLMLMFTRAYL